MRKGYGMLRLDPGGTSDHHSASELAIGPAGAGAFLTFRYQEKL